MQIKYKIHATLIIGLLLHVSAYSLSPICNYIGYCLTNELHIQYFFALSAFAYCAYMLSLYFLVNTKGLKAIVTFMGTLYVSNLIDVLLFDRKAISINEYAGAFAAIIITFIEYKGWHNDLKQYLAQRIVNLENMMKNIFVKILAHCKFVRKTK